ncbi:MAG: ACP S-malonyltransferase [Candidatus Hydrogenedentes bacterium]|nr:ACP S-malonyltransferase [Candidatus Hydrogenedentota bacterium]
MSFFLFPGQGSQVPGMGKDFYEASASARDIFDRAEALRGGGFLKSIFDGTAEELSQTRLTQVALLTVEVAIAKHLLAQGYRPTGCAGHSLGEISALVLAESLSFEDAFRFVEIRARLMSEDVPAGGMMAVIGAEPEAIETALPAGAEVANYNGPQQTIISGSIEALDQAEASLKAAGIKRLMRLPVSGPFHSSYLKPAAERLAETLAAIEFKTPVVCFISSVSGRDEAESSVIRELLAKQICSPVRWTDVMARIGSGNALEVGPGKVLQGIAKRTSGAPNVIAVGTLEAVANMEAQV